MWRDLARALSLANLCFFYPTVTLFLTPANRYYMAQPPGPADLAAWLLNLLLLAAAFWLGARFVRRWENDVSVRVALLALTGLLLFGALQLQRSVPSPIPLVELDPLVRRAAKLVALALAAAAAIGFFLGVARRPRVLLLWGAQLLLALSPFFPLIAAQTAWAALAPRAPTGDTSPTLAVAARPPAGRVVLLLFDELDYGIAFEKRPPDLQLPEFDRLQHEALTASQAYPPAGNTLESLPSLLCGRRVASVDKRGASELMVRFDGDAAPISWRETETLFSLARDLGGRSALAGWYHPYPRILGKDVDRCTWQTYYYWTDRQGSSLVDTMGQQVALSELPGKAPAARLNREHHVRSFQRIERDALVAVSDPSFNLVFAHYPVPHMPGIFDRTRNRIGPVQGMELEGYLGNLALADRALGNVRRAMTASGEWDRSTVIVTSDHWLRLAGLDPSATFRVPLLVKLPHQRQGLQFDPRLNTVLLHDLALKQLTGDLRTPKELAVWLDHRRQDVDQR